MSKFTVKVLKPIAWSPTGVFTITSEPGEVVTLGSQSAFDHFISRGDVEPTAEAVTGPPPASSPADPPATSEPSKPETDPAKKSVRATDAAVTVAAELAIDLATVKGTGKDNTITVADVRNAAGG